MKGNGFMYLSKCYENLTEEFIVPQKLIFLNSKN